MSRGDVIFREGDPGGALYFIVSGKVTLTVEQREVAELGDSEVFGEMSIFDREPRGTTATVTEDTELLRVSASEFHDSVRDSVDLAEAVITVMNYRLRDADRRLSAARARLAVLTKTPEEHVEPRVPAHPAETATHAADDEVE
jgi:CRP-like cAMP-binding protein